MEIYEYVKENIDDKFVELKNYIDELFENQFNDNIYLNTNVVKSQSTLDLKNLLKSYNILCFYNFFNYEPILFNK